jgi:hypothetical protein
MMAGTWWKKSFLLSSLKSTDFHNHHRWEDLYGRLGIQGTSSSNPLKTKIQEQIHWRGKKNRFTLAVSPVLWGDTCPLSCLSAQTTFLLSPRFLPWGQWAFEEWVPGTCLFQPCKFCLWGSFLLTPLTKLEWSTQLMVEGGQDQRTERRTQQPETWTQERAMDPT